MGQYIVRRLLSAFPVVFMVTLIAFFIMKLVPGDPAMIIAGMEATPQEIEQVRQQLGLNEPIFIQLGNWYWALLHGDLGDLFLLGRSVTTAIIERLPVTLSISFFALIMTVSVAVGSGVLAALRQNTWVDQLFMTFALLGVSIPNFWLGLLLIILFAVHMSWLPSGGYVPLTEDPWGWLRSTILPSFSLALAQMGLLARITRSTMLEVLRQDYIRTAQAKGMKTYVVIGKHALKNVMIPVITVIGIVFSLMPRRLHRHRDGLFRARSRPSDRIGHHAPRLSGHSGQPVVRRRHARRHQPDRGPPLRLFRSASPLREGTKLATLPQPRRAARGSC